MPLIPFPTYFVIFDGVSSTDQSEVGLLPGCLLLVHLQLDLLVHRVQALQYLWHQRMDLLGRALLHTKVMLTVHCAPPQDCTAHSLTMHADSTWCTYLRMYGCMSIPVKIATVHTAHTHSHTYVHTHLPHTPHTHVRTHTCHTHHTHVHTLQTQESLQYTQYHSLESQAHAPHHSHWVLLVDDG